MFRPDPRCLPAEHLTADDIALRDTSITTLCKRIKAAYFEGWEDINTEYDEEAVHSFWERSQAKKIHDILLKQAEDQ